MKDKLNEFKQKSLMLLMLYLCSTLYSCKQKPLEELNQPQLDIESRFGFNLVSWDQANIANSNTWKKSVQEMYDIGIRSFTIITYRFIDVNSGEISFSSKYNLAPPPDNEEIMEAMNEGKRLGMQISLNPFLEIDNPSGIGHKWRGDLDFSGDELNVFFENYTSYISEMSQLADQIGIHRLYIGSELKMLALNSEAYSHWIDIIRQIRGQVASNMKLSYAANHDNYEAVPFWDELDEIGIDAYFSLAKSSQAKGVGNPSVNLIEAHWEKLLKPLRTFSQKYEKSVVISEWGAVPFDMTTHQPWNWSPSSISDLPEQINAYSATFNSVKSQGAWLSGVQFWHWGMAGSFESQYSITANSSISKVITQYLRKSETQK